MLIISLGAILGLIALVVFFKNPRFGEKEKNCEYVKKGDSQAQSLYDEEKNPKKPSFSAKELLEMSWKFLYDITEIVLYKFTARAKKETHECGRRLVEAGARYQHTVEYTPAISGAYSKKLEDSKKDSNEVQR